MFVAHSGGSPADVVLGLTRLGHPVTLVNRLGADPFGEMVSARPRPSGVRVDAQAGRRAGRSAEIAANRLRLSLACFSNTRRRPAQPATPHRPPPLPRVLLHPPPPALQAEQPPPHRLRDHPSDTRRGVRLTGVTSVAL